MDKTESVLDNTIRRMIYNHILANPGVSFVVLKRAFNLNESTLRYHLDYLKRNEKIIFSFEKGKRNYYPQSIEMKVLGGPDNSNIFETYNLTDTQERIITIIKKYPKINQKELVRRTGINRITLSKNIKKLMNLCMVRKIPNGNKVNYVFIENKQLRFEILKQLLVKLFNKEIDEKTFLELKRKLEK